MSAKFPTTYPAKSPYCEHTLDPATAVDGRVTCACGRSSDVRWVQELGWLQARGDWVGQRVAAGEPWFDSAKQTSATTAESRPTSSLGERVLYLLGGLSLVVAVAVFAAVGWDRIGAIGQAVTLIVVTVLASFVAVRTRTRLTGLSNTAAVIASAVAATGLYSAPLFGLIDSSLSDAGSWYPLTMTVMVTAISVAAGLRTQIAGWLVVGPIGTVVAAVLAMEEVLPDLVSGWAVAGIQIVILTAAVLLLNRFVHWISAGQPAWRGVSVFASLAQIFLAFVGLTQLHRFIDMSQRPWFNAVCLALAVAMWAHAGFRWRSPEGAAQISKLDLRAARPIAALLTGFALSNLLALPRGTADTKLLWLSMAAAAVVGGVLALVPKSVARLGNFTTPGFIAAIALWLVHLLKMGTGYSIEQGRVAYALSAYFGIITVVGATRWWLDRRVPSFVLLVFAGLGTVTSVIGEYYGDRDMAVETFSLPMAAWLALAFGVLRWRAGRELNTGVWVGIPLGMALIPSAVSAVAILESTRLPATQDWVRLWVVLIAGVVFTVWGAHGRITGLLWPGTVAYIATAFPQLWVDLGLIIPRWLLFAFFGGLLISVAARFEHLQKLRAESGSWARVFR